MSRPFQAFLAVVLLAAALGLGWRSIQQTQRQLAVQRACEATSAERHAEALEWSEGQTGPDPDGRIAAECRCWSLLATDRETDCVALLEGILQSEDASTWVPDPALVRRVIWARRDGGRHEPAADLARRAAAAHPDDLTLVQSELVTRAAIEGEERVLEDIEARLGESTEAPLALRLVLGVAYARRSEPEAVLRVLSDEIPTVGNPHTPMWVELRTDALADLSRFEAVQRTYDAWLAGGANPADVRARMALRLSLSHLRHPDRSWLEILLDSIEERSDIENESLIPLLYERAIGHLLMRGRREDALSLFEEAVAQFPMDGLTREQIVGGVTPESQMAETPTGRGRLVFRLSDGDSSQAAGGTLWLQPGPDAPSDATWERIPWSSSETTAERAPGPWPHRWVYRDAADAVRASGSVWPVPGRTVEVTIEARSPAPAPDPARLEQRPGDGRRRIFVVLPDGLDWRLVQYLRARGELPVLDRLLQAGHRAVLRSFPPLTAAAMESLVWPTRGRYVTFTGLVHRMGLEVAGLASVGRNPLGFLSGLLPEGDSFFEAVGQGDRVAANMLFSHGLIDAGRHAELLGPQGRRRPARSVPAYRPLTPDEKTRYPGLRRGGSVGPLAESLAAQMDAGVTFAREGEVDVLMLRLEPLDILTHMFFGDLTGTRQDDATSPLLDAYRYVDSRVGELARALDEDDVLVVMSDHGIRTAMEHSVDAVFVAWGEGIPTGRVEGRPDLRGVPSVLAALAGVRTEWPRTGVAPFVEARLHADAGHP